MIDGNRRAIALDELFLEGLHTMLGKLVYERRCVDHTRVLDAYFGLGRGVLNQIQLKSTEADCKISQSIKRPGLSHSVWVH